MAPKAPRSDAPKAEHRKHAEEFLEREEHKKPPKDRKLDTDTPPEEGEDA